MRSLQEEFDRLNEDQKEAVRSEKNTVALAGPGSGKTQTLVIKIAHLLKNVIWPPRGLACITYNNDTVREFRQRLLEFGVHPGPRVFLGTLHSFCLNCILRPYGPLVYEHLRKGIQVAAAERAGELFQKAVERIKPGASPSWYSAPITRLRRRIDCEEDISGAADEDHEILRLYLPSLEDSALIDFDGMVSKALELVRQHDWVGQFLQARFPWLIIDEYQDLGGPLHTIVTTLVEKAQTNVLAVGDPDQTIYDFTGANPRYLVALTKRPDFATVRLRFNYRSGRKLIDASQAALAPEVPRDYQPDPKRGDEGEVFFYRARGSMDDHARIIAQAILPELHARRIALEQIAILYRQKGQLLTAILTELARHHVPFLAERDSNYPRTPLVRWLQDCAGLSIAGLGSLSAAFDELLGFYHTLTVSAGVADSELTLPTRVRFFEGVFSPCRQNTALAEWLFRFDCALDLKALLSAAPDHSEDLEGFAQLLDACQDQGPLASHTVGDFAREGRVQGKLVVTTLHSSKGRQFDAVILPGLLEGVLPRRPWNRKLGYTEPSPPVLSEDRRLFYVGFTRARHYVFLVYGDSFVNDKGYAVGLGESRFVTEIRKQLESQ